MYRTNLNNYSHSHHSQLKVAVFNFTSNKYNWRAFEEINTIATICILLIGLDKSITIQNHHVKGDGRINKSEILGPSKSNVLKYSRTRL